VAEDLSQQERDLIANLIRDGKPVPARYIPSISDSPLKVELIWPGKSAVTEYAVIPFQSIEHIDEPRQGTSQQFDLFSMSEASGRQSGGWTNKLIWGDNSIILSSIVNGPMRSEIDKAGGLKLVYIDPPFDVGADFSIDIEIGDETVTKAPSIVEEVAFRDTWGKGQDSFLAMFYQRIRLIHSLLRDDGVLYLHCDWRVSANLRLVMDEVFGIDNYLNEIIWQYEGTQSPSKKKLATKHDTIFRYAKNIESLNPNELYFEHEVSRDYSTLKKDDKGYFRIQGFGDYSEASIAKFEAEGRVYHTSKGTKYLKHYIEERDGKLFKQKKLPDVWTDITQLGTAVQKEKLNYPTQKPEKLLQRIIEIDTVPGDLIADFFCGSGTSLAVAEKLGRKWIGSDIGRFAIHTSRKRLITVQRNASSKGDPYRAFEILNLGGYERAHQVGLDPSLDEDARNVQAAIKREEFIDLILSAYGAQRSDQLIPFSGSKGGTAILIGAIDSAVTQDQVQNAIDTALSVGISRVDVLGFEFEMGISPAMSDAAKEQGLTLTVRYIPNEVFDKRAIAKGQVKFYEAGYVEAKCEVKNKTLQVTLTDFGVFYRQNDADETAAQLRNGNAKVVVDQGQVVRVAKDKKGIISKENLTSNWQDWIDYWAVDFDFASQPETITVIEDGKEVRKRTGKYIFENEWQSFRTNSDRSLELTSSPFSYADPGNYSVAVKVIDIFGNDTTRVFKIKVK
jgi:DNA modification methylase